VSMQLAIDNGFHWCGPCGRGGYHTFCGHCGQRFLGAELEWQKCAVCDAVVSTEWCPRCGFNVKSEFLRDVKAGRVDWQARIADAHHSVTKIFAKLGVNRSAAKKPSILEAVRATWGANG